MSFERIVFVSEPSRDPIQRRRAGPTSLLSTGVERYCCVVRSPDGSGDVVPVVVISGISLSAFIPVDAMNRMNGGLTLRRLTIADVNVVTFALTVLGIFCWLHRLHIRFVCLYQPDDLRATISLSTDAAAF